MSNITYNNKTIAVDPTKPTADEKWTAANANEVKNAVNSKVDAESGKGLSTNDYTTTEKNKLANQSGTNTGDQDLSGLQPKESGKGLSTNDYTTTEKNKLAQQSGVNTGDQDLSILQPRETGKGLSTNDFTNTLKAKLDGAQNKYLGQVGTGCYMPRNILTGTNQYARTRDMIITTEDVVNPKVGWARWRVSNGTESAPTSDGTIIAALEYPTGVYTYSNQTIANSGNAVTQTTNAVTLLDFNVSIPKGSRVYLWVLQFSALGGVLFRQGQHALNARPGCYLQNGSGTPPNLLDTFPGQASEYSYPPVLFLGQTLNPSVLVFGDSREEGGLEGNRAPHYNLGIVNGTVGRVFGYTSLAESGTFLNTFSNGTSANRANRVALAQYFTHVVNAWGVNDFGQGRTVAQLLADRATFATFFPTKTVIGTTIMPYVTTNDAYRTTANQGLGTTQPKIRQVNRAIRAGINGEKFIFDTAKAVDQYDRDAWQVSADPSATVNPLPACTFTGSISSSGVLTVTAIASGSLVYGSTLTDILDTTGGIAYTGLPYPGTMVLEQLTGTTGGIGTYTVSIVNPTATPSKTMYVGGWASPDGLHSNALMAEQARVRLTDSLIQIRL